MVLVDGALVPMTTNKEQKETGTRVEAESVEVPTYVEMTTKVVEEVKPLENKDIPVEPKPEMNKYNNKKNRPKDLSKLPYNKWTKVELYRFCIDKGWKKVHLNQDTKSDIIEFIKVMTEKEKGYEPEL